MHPGNLNARTRERPPTSSVTATFLDLSPPFPHLHPPPQPRTTTLPPLLTSLLAWAPQANPARSFSTHNPAARGQRDVLGQSRTGGASAQKARAIPPARTRNPAARAQRDVERAKPSPFISQHPLSARGRGDHSFPQPRVPQMLLTSSACSGNPALVELQHKARAIPPAQTTQVNFHWFLQVELQHKAQAIPPARTIQVNFQRFLQRFGAPR